MAVKILIKRKVSDEKSDELDSLLKRMRVLTMSQDGYISGETLKRVDQPGENLVISTWQTTEDWNRWFINQERLKIQEAIDHLLGEQTRYEVFEYF